MKKIFLIISSLFIISSSFAETKFFSGFCNFEDIYSISSTNKFCNDFYNSYGTNVRVESMYKYFYQNTSLIFNEKYFDVSNTTKLKYSIFYIGTDFDFGTNIKYLDIVSGVTFGRYVFDWLKFYCDSKVGFVPINQIGLHDNRNIFLSSLEVRIVLFDFITFYAGLESTQSCINIITWSPFYIKNKIGLKFDYYFGNFGVYGLVDYYCLHPEIPYKMENTDLNGNKRIISLGMTFKI